MFSVFLATALGKFSGENMNGDIYHAASTPGADPDKFNFPLNYKDRPEADNVEYVDLYSGKISSRYSEVTYRPLPEVKLPAELIKRFDGKVMALYGLEWNQVYREEDGDKDVPMNVAYNHHGYLNIYGSTAETEEITVTGPKDSRLDKNTYHATVSAGDKVKVVKSKPTPPALKDDAWSWVPDHGMLGVGAEHRNTLATAHPGFADFVRSPERFSVTVMQIDTWNRDKMDKYNMTGKFVPGPYPKGIPSPLDADYSGLLECPMTTRVTKKYDATFETTSDGGTCGHALLSADECFAAGQEILPGYEKFTTTEVDSNDTPYGCSISIGGGPAERKEAIVVYNTNKDTTVKCGSEDGVDEIMGEQTTNLGVTLAVSVAKKFDNSLGGKSNATITMSGPSDVYFAVGFGASDMGGAPYTIVVEPTGVHERKLGYHEGGDQLADQVYVESNEVKDGVRTVVMTRYSVINDDQYFAFDVDSDGFDFIAAIGFSGTFGYHKSKAVNALKFFPSTDSGQAACICADNPAKFGKATGQLVYTSPELNSTIGFTNECLPYPQGDRLKNKNPTCDIRTYKGGFLACHDGWFLLDADQEIPWSNQPLEYEIKVRLWFAELNETYHKPMGYQYVGLGSTVENDVVKVDEGEDPLVFSEGLVTFARQPGMPGERALTIMAHFHVSAGVSMEIWEWDSDKNEKGKEICKMSANPGQGRPDVRFDEKDYISIDYCYFSDNAEYGLESPPVLSDKTFYVKKVENATYGHTGDMSILQIRTMYDYSVIKAHEVQYMSKAERAQYMFHTGQALKAPEKRVNVA